MTKLIRFQFNCPEDKVSRALEIVNEFEVLKAAEMPYQVTAFVPNDKDQMTAVSGKEIQGVCSDEILEDIMTRLADEKIAGFSRETMILRMEYENPSG